MYQQQAYQTASYRGNQQGHDQYLRSDSNQPNNQRSFAQQNQQQQAYQPSGYVQSVYGQNQQNQPQFQNQGQFQQQNQPQFQNQGQFQQNQSPNAFHTANYRGNQQGHDSYLRSDSTQPNQAYGQQSQRSIIPSIMQQQNQPQFQNQGQFQQNQNPNAFHTASYRGNQQGHDSYLRSDSTQPNQAYGQQSQQSIIPSIMQQQNQPQFQNQGQFQQNQSPNAFHTASYRGNQQGHDSYLRSDSTQPNQGFGQQFQQGQQFNSRQSYTH